ncbi:hypothetical protein [Thioalkalivibrio sp. XN8]|uniref:hypothetical protein n=1 Tax=Thioalkalivibrio sp. XN8 TaxID=2712863 RepID=UPI0013EAE7DD|nr:hypothetical protein [Thioalkalivibrio sp. XN8]NGP52963.1 hypothetical protein [Thioalkalivibrio sp. XN8]
MPMESPLSSVHLPIRVAGRRAWWCLAALLLPAVAPAQEAGQARDATRGFIECLELRDPTERLACYDRMAVAVIEFGLALPEAAGERGAPAAAAAAPAAPAPTPEEEFGLEQERAAETASIKAGVVGGFQGWTGDTVFELDNGQVWQQTGTGRYEYSGQDRAVIITRGFLGSFSLQPEGLNRTVRVQRIK